MTEQPTCNSGSTSLGVPSSMGFQVFSPHSATSSSTSVQPSFGTSFSFGTARNLQNSFNTPTLVSNVTAPSTTTQGVVSVASSSSGTGFQLTTTLSSQAPLFSVSTAPSNVCSGAPISGSLPAAAPKLSFGFNLGGATSLASQAVTSTSGSAVTPGSTVVTQPSQTSLSTATTPSTAITSTTVAPLSSLSTASSTPASSIPGLTVATKGPTMTYNQLEELINKWSHELEEQERYFMEEAERIVQWDQALIGNGEKIATLYEKVDACKSEQTQLEQELDFIESQQRELDNLLEPLERAANELPPGQLHSDFEREAIFQLATNVDLELDQLLSDLRDMADQVNAFTSRSAVGALELNSASDLKDQADSPLRTQTVQGGGPGAVQQVTRILNCHMHSLNWIHQNTQDLIERVKLLEGT